MPFLEIFCITVGYAYGRQKIDGFFFRKFSVFLGKLLGRDEKMLKTPYNIILLFIYFFI